MTPIEADHGHFARERMRRYRGNGAMIVLSHSAGETQADGANTQRPSDSRALVVVVDQVDGHDEARPLRHWPLHSPTGFAYGYGGSGPADLALAILLDFLEEWPTEQQMAAGESRAWALHHHFKWEIIARLEPGWELSALDVFDWLQSETATMVLNHWEPVMAEIEAEEEALAKAIAERVRSE